MPKVSKHIAVLLYGPTGGGASRRCLTLACEFAQLGHRVDLVVVDPAGPLRSLIPDTVRLVPLNSAYLKLPIRPKKRRWGAWASIWSLAAYLRREQPDVILSGVNTMHLAAVWAHMIARQPVRLVLRICTHLGASASNAPRKRPVLNWLARRFYPRADVIVTLSRDMALDTSRRIGVSNEQVTVIPNPVVSPEIALRANEPLDHPWFSPGSPPVILGVGRLVRQKDFPTLLKAFAEVRQERALHLVILGEPKDAGVRAHLVELAEYLGVSDDLYFGGMVENPFAYMARSGVFVLSSAWEGLSGALIEAMACGCPVISTDCPGGSSETLAGGAYGSLVPVGDYSAMAVAIRRELDHPHNAALLKDRAAEFGIRPSVERYLEVLLPPMAHA